MSATTNTAVSLFREFKADWNAALNPCVGCLIDSCPEQEQPALHALLDNFLIEDPFTPPYSPVQMRRLHEKVQPIIDRVMNDPAMMAQQDQLDAAWRDKPWWRKRWIRLRTWLWLKKVALSGVGRKKPWE